MSGGLRYQSVDMLPPKWQEQARKQISPREPEAKKPRSKYNAERVTIDGIKFDSKKEARFYMLLRQRQAAGDLLRFHRQVTFDLEGGIRYICDFQIFENDGTVHYVDTKGMETETFKLKRKQVKARYGVEIETV
jgi:hypothetical protein